MQAAIFPPLINQVNFDAKCFLPLKSLTNILDYTKVHRESRALRSQGAAFQVLLLASVSHRTSSSRTTLPNHHGNNRFRHLELYSFRCSDLGSARSRPSLPSAVLRLGRHFCAYGRIRLARFRACRDALHSHVRS
jgi:hypothetical protein